MAQQTDTTAAESDDEQFPVILLAFQPRGAKVYVHRGPNQTDYPVKLQQVDGDDVMSIDNEANRLTKRLVGIQFVVAKQGTDRADELETLVEDIQTSDDPLEDILERRKQQLPDGL